VSGSLERTRPPTVWRGTHSWALPPTLQLTRLTTSINLIFEGTQLASSSRHDDAAHLLLTIVLSRVVRFAVSADEEMACPTSLGGGNLSRLIYVGSFAPGGQLFLVVAPFTRERVLSQTIASVSRDC